MVAATEALILEHNPAWPLAGGTGTYPQWVTAAAVAGFTGIESFSFDVDQPYSSEAWRGRIRASAGVGGSLAPDAVTAFDAALAAQMTARFPGDAHWVPHRCWAMVAARP